MPEPIASRPAFTGHAETLPWAWAERRLAHAWNYWLATAASGRGPYLRPIWALWCDAGLLFTTSPASRKARDFLVDPRVSVHAELEREVVVVDGTVTEASPTDAEADAYAAKYGSRPPESQHWFVVRPHQAYVAIEESFPAGATLFDFAPVT